jgi:putative DNA primase/helicase
METMNAETKVNTPQIERSYRYEDEKGKLLYEVVRYNPKGFSQRRPDGNGGYINNIQGVRRVLYKLPQLIETPLDVPVYICEGEKDADRLWSLGLPATTCPGGAGKWLPEFNEFFRGRPVGVPPDNDEAGRRHATQVAEALCNTAACIKILELPGLPPKGDVSDWLDAGHKFGELSILFDDAPQYVKEEPWTRKADVVKMSEIEPEDVQWLWPNRFPLGMISLLVGDPDLGKSYLSMYLAATVSNGGTWPDGSPCPKAKALILNGEDSLARTVGKRLKVLGADADKVIAIRAMRQKISKDTECNDFFNISSDRLELERVIKANPGVQLVIIDPLSAYFGNADTFKESVVRSILAPLADMASRYDVALVGIMHLNKGNSSKAIYKTQGSLAFPATARAVWLVSNDPSNPNSKRRFLINSKFNIGERPSSLAFEIKDGKVVFESEPVNITAQDVLTSQSNVEAPERDRAVEWIKQLLAGGQSISSNEINKLAQQEGFSEKTLRKAREELGIKFHSDFDEEGKKFWSWRLPNKEGGQLKLPNLAEAQAKALAQLKEAKKKYGLA